MLDLLAIPSIYVANCQESHKFIVYGKIKELKALKAKKKRPRSMVGRNGSCPFRFSFVQTKSKSQKHPPLDTTYTPTCNRKTIRFRYYPIKTRTRMLPTTPVKRSTSLESMNRTMKLH